jgi:hypothetical protein
MLWGSGLTGGRMVAQPRLTKNQTVTLGRVTLSIPQGLDPKPYIREILTIEIAALTHPQSQECLIKGLAAATSDADFASLLETFHLLSSTANAEKLFEAIAQSERSSQSPQSVDQLRQELGLAEAAH